eukprot:scaffold127117_cov42-Phaeocystis_antarctica.AAC.1
MQARRAGGTHLSTLFARGLSTTVVRPHGQRARAAQEGPRCSGPGRLRLAQRPQREYRQTGPG